MPVVNSKVLEKEKTTPLDLLFIEIVEAAMEPEGSSLKEYDVWEANLINTVRRVKSQVVMKYEGG